MVQAKTIIVSGPGYQAVRVETGYEEKLYDLYSENTIIKRISKIIFLKGDIKDSLIYVCSKSFMKFESIPTSEFPHFLSFIT